MTLIEMYDAVEAEIEAINKSILAKWDALDMSTLTMSKYDLGYKEKGYIRNHIVDTLNAYADVKHPTNFFGTLTDFLKNRALYHFAPLL